VGDAVHSSGSAALRWPAVITFVPMLWTAGLVRALPESSGVELV